MKKILFFFLGLISTIFVYSQPLSATFEVDLSLYQGSYSTVEFYRAGSSHSMINSGGNIYTYTTIVQPGPSQTNYTYKFIMLSGVGSITITAPDGDIEGSSTFTLSIVGQTTSLTSDGAVWRIHL